MAGLFLDPWQQMVLEHGLGEREDGKWAAFEVGLVLSRQNGKGAILEARELAGLFLLGERLIVHSAHQFDTSLEAFRRLLALIEDTPDLDRRVRRVSRSHGEEGIELKGGQRIRFRTRTSGGGRGFTADCVIFDEAMDLSEASIAAILPTLSARPNSQVWYTGSAVDRTMHPNGVVFSRVREAGVNGKSKSLAFFEWSVDATPDELDWEDLADRELWRQATPALGIRISEDYIANELASPIGKRGFAVERLAAGDWWTTADLTVLDLAKWADLADRDSEASSPGVLAFDVAPDRSSGAVATVGRRADGNWHVEVLHHDRGTGWIVPMLIDLNKTVVYDGSGASASLAAELEREKVKLHSVNTREHVDACGLLFDGVDQGTIRHLAQGDLSAAVRGAAQRPLGDRWAWSRKTSSVDITPLVAVTLALWGSANLASPTPRVINLATVEA